MSLPLKWQIQLWHLGILLVVLSILGTGFYQYEKARRYDAVDEKLISLIPMFLGPHGVERKPHPSNGAGQTGRTYLGPATDVPAGWEQRNPASNFLETPDGTRVLSFSSQEPEIFNERFVPLGFYVFLEFKHRNRRSFISEGFPDIEVPEIERSGQLSRTREGRYRELFHNPPQFRILLGYDLQSLSTSLTTLKLQITGTLLLLFFLAWGIGYLLVSRSLRPLQNITKTTRQIASAQLDARIPEARASDAREMQNLTTDLNIAFSQLELLFGRITRFTADASHELRTPLTALLAQLEHGLKAPRSEQEYVKILEVSQRSGNRIRRITEQLIELARYDSGRTQMEFEPISLRNMLISLSEELEPYVIESGCQLKPDLQGEEVVCDPFKLEQVITNLINNAIQHNPQPVTITLKSRVEAKHFQIDVIDNGKGIDPQNIDKLFDRFYQESKSRSKESGSDRSYNVGLGLAIAEAIIKAHGGEIQVTSTLGSETRFRLIIPLRDMS